MDKIYCVTLEDDYLTNYNLQSVDPVKVRNKKIYNLLISLCTGKGTKHAQGQCQVHSVMKNKMPKTLLHGYECRTCRH